MMVGSIQSPLLHAVTLLAFVLHIGGGVIGLISGTIAIFATKGSPLHRSAGNVFFFSMLVMAVFAVYLAVAMPDQLINVFIAVFAFYLVATAWMTVKRREGAIGTPEKIALVVALVLCAPFAVLSFQMAVGMAPFFKSAVPLKGPVLIALYSFTTVIGIAALADVKVVFVGGISGAPRIARHLWRMCLGLTLAAGSGFTNGVARLLPGPYHVPTILFLPQFLPLILLIFWMVRVRFTGWFAREGLASVR
jgi:hypothetical protein